MVVYVDTGFHGKKGDASNLKVCQRGGGQSDFRFLIETVLSLMTRLLSLKRLSEREQGHLEAHLCFASAAFNLLVDWDCQDKRDKEAGQVRLAFPDFCL